MSARSYSMCTRYPWLLMESIVKLKQKKSKAILPPPAQTCVFLGLTGGFQMREKFKSVKKASRK